MARHELRAIGGEELTVVVLQTMQNRYSSIARKAPRILPPHALWTPCPPHESFSFLRIKLVLYINRWCSSSGSILLLHKDKTNNKILLMSNPKSPEEITGRDQQKRRATCTPIDAEARYKKKTKVKQMYSFGHTDNPAHSK
jgi:hypothetical protein